MRLRYQRTSGEARRVLNQEGESGRFEFKQTVDAVKPDVLVAAANAVVVDAIQEGFVTILVGVAEKENPTTGAVTGKVIGITNHAQAEARRSRVEKAKSQIRDRAAATRPVPVDLTIIEENVGTTKPFLRLHVAPSYIPHHTADGKRVTRYGASTRAIEDEELLDLYLRREAIEFERRFRTVADSLEDRLHQVASTVDDLGGNIEERLRQIDQLARHTAEEAEEGRTYAEEAAEAVSLVLTQQEFGDAVSAIFERLSMTHEGTWWALRQRREHVWLVFSLVAERKDGSPAWETATTRVRRFLDSDFAVSDYIANRREIEEWADQVAGDPPAEWSARRWGQAVQAVERVRRSGLPPVTDPEAGSPLVRFFDK